MGNKTLSYSGDSNGVIVYPKADAVIQSLEIQHKADAELIAADRRNMEQMKERIKELEAKLALTSELVDSAKEHLRRAEHIVESNKMMWVSVKDRMPNECKRIWLWDGYDIVDGYWHEGQFRNYPYGKPIENQDIRPITMWQDYKPKPPQNKAP